MDCENGDDDDNGELHAQRRKNVKQRDVDETSRMNDPGS